MWVIILASVLITPLIAIHEPPSRRHNRAKSVGCASTGSGIEALGFKCICSRVYITVLVSVDRPPSEYW